tara:strand:+ start:250 stop:429 length:180 start_codon:yes stop_codon:yes gene_type:complete
MENKEHTAIENAQHFALQLFGSVELYKALKKIAEQKEGSQELLNLVTLALLQHPEPAEA